VSTSDRNEGALSVGEDERDAVIDLAGLRLFA
jgi:hypothetical protein